MLLAVLGATAILFDAGFGMAAVRFGRDESLDYRKLVGAAGYLQGIAVLVATAAFLPIMAIVGPSGEGVLPLVGVTGAIRAR